MLRRGFLKITLSAMAAVYAPASLLQGFDGTKPVLDAKLRSWPRTTSIIEIIKQRRREAMMKLADMLESHFWNPTNQDRLAIPYNWNTYDAA